MKAVILLSLSITASVALVSQSSAQQNVPFNSCASQQTPAELDRQIDALIAKMTPAERISQLEDRAVAVPRLGIPAYNWWNEGLHGLARNGHATVFPQAIALGATFDPELAEKVGAVVSTEARANFNHHQDKDSLRYAGLTIWSPNINIFRDPRWGRGQETYGEDPFLTGSIGSGFVRGIQDNGNSQNRGFYLKANATAKHLAVHSGPELIRDGFDAKISDHDRYDTYFPAFRALTAADGDAHAEAIMCSYNAINGVPACANTEMLDHTLRDSWHFSGYVVSDCDAVDEVNAYHYYEPDGAHGAAVSLKAGTVLDCGKAYNHLNEALTQGLVTEGDINQALHKLLYEKLRLGLLQPASCSPYSTITADAIDTPESRALALREAAESIVLLRNDRNTLPLRTESSRIAVIGPNADLISAIEANYHGTVRHPKTILDGLKDDLHGARLSYAQGSTLATGFPLAVPRTALRAGVAKSAAEGLSAEYFSNSTFSGVPVARRVDTHIDFDLDRATPVDKLSADKPWSARWTGVLVPPASGSYKLRVNVERCWDCKSHDGYALWIDNKKVLGDNGKDNPLRDIVSLDWPDTKAHAIRLEYTHTGEDEGLHLEWQPSDSTLLNEAIATAKNADEIVAVVGLSPDLEGEALKISIPGFNGGDRVDLNLPEPQRKLLRALGDLGKPMTVVLTTGSAVTVGDEAKNAGAVLEAWYPGEEGGHALAQILSGETSPSGKMPLTVYRSANDLPRFTDYSMANRTYRYFYGPVEYPFGFGLSYSQFEFGPVQMEQSIKAGDSLHVKAKVKNTGSRDADEVAELYIVPPQGDGMPHLTLQGINRVHLKVGESREVAFTLTPRQLSFVSPDGKRAVRAGSYRVYVGGNQPKQPATDGTSFKITGEQGMEP